MWLKTSSGPASQVRNQFTGSAAVLPSQTTPDSLQYPSFLYYTRTPTEHRVPQPTQTNIKDKNEEIAKVLRRCTRQTARQRVARKQKQQQHSSQAGKTKLKLPGLHDSSTPKNAPRVRHSKCTHTSRRKHIHTMPARTDTFYVPKNQIETE